MYCSLKSEVRVVHLRISRFLRIQTLITRFTKPTGWAGFTTPTGAARSTTPTGGVRLTSLEQKEPVNSWTDLVHANKGLENGRICFWAQETCLTKNVQVLAFPFWM